MVLTNDNYYDKTSSNSYMSYSQFKMFKECEAKALAVIKGEWQDEKTTSLLVGSYVDSWLDGDDEFEKFKERNKDKLYTKQGSLRADFLKAEQIIDAIKKDSFFCSKLKNGRRQVIMTGTIGGVPFKGKFDSLFDDLTVDGKVMKDVNDIWKNGEKMPFWKAYGYDYQGAIYQELRIQNEGEKIPFELAVITKEDIPDKHIYRFSDKTLETALDEVKALAPHFQAVKEGLEEPYACGCCNYCKSRKLLKESDIEVI